MESSVVLILIPTSLAINGLRPIGETQNKEMIVIFRFTHIKFFDWNLSNHSGMTS
jgi:hypothetical protein